MANYKVIPDKEAITVANTIFEKLILEHGTPEVLLSDNGKEFTNDPLACVCQEFNIEQHFTSPYMPRSNGKMENFNKFLNLHQEVMSGGHCGMGSGPGPDFHLHIGVALTHPPVRCPTPLCITRIHHYQYRN